MHDREKIEKTEKIKEKNIIRVFNRNCRPVWR